MKDWNVSWEDGHCAGLGRKSHSLFRFYSPTSIFLGLLQDSCGWEGEKVERYEYKAVRWLGPEDGLGRGRKTRESVSADC